MPIYEFACEPCKDTFELLISPSKIDSALCPKCGSPKIKRLISTFAARTSGGDGHSHSSGACAGCASGNCANCGH